MNPYYQWFNRYVTDVILIVTVYNYKSEQLKVKSIAQGPNSMNLAVVRFEPKTFWPLFLNLYQQVPPISVYYLRGLQDMQMVHTCV